MRTKNKNTKTKTDAYFGVVVTRRHGHHYSSVAEFFVPANVDLNVHFCVVGRAHDILKQGKSYVIIQVLRKGYREFN